MRLFSFVLISWDQTSWVLIPSSILLSTLEMLLLRLVLMSKACLSLLGLLVVSISLRSPWWTSYCIEQILWRPKCPWHQLVLVILWLPWFFLGLFEFHVVLQRILGSQLSLDEIRISLVWGVDLFCSNIPIFGKHATHVSSTWLSISWCRLGMLWQIYPNFVVAHRWSFPNMLSRRWWAQTTLPCIRKVHIVYKKLFFTPLLPSF